MARGQDAKSTGKPNIIRAIRFSTQRDARFVGSFLFEVEFLQWRLITDFAKNEPSFSTNARRPHHNDCRGIRGRGVTATSNQWTFQYSSNYKWIIMMKVDLIFTKNKLYGPNGSARRRWSLLSDVGKIDRTSVKASVFVVTARNSAFRRRNCTAARK